MPKRLIKQLNIPQSMENDRDKVELDRDRIMLDTKGIIIITARWMVCIRVDRGRGGAREKEGLDRILMSIRTPTRGSGPFSQIQR